MSTERTCHRVSFSLPGIQKDSIHTVSLQDLPLSLLFKPVHNAGITPHGIIHPAQEKYAVKLPRECNCRTDKVHLILHLTHSSPSHIHTLTYIMNARQLQARGKLLQRTFGVDMNEELGIGMQCKYQPPQLCRIGMG